MNPSLAFQVCEASSDKAWIQGWQFATAPHLSGKSTATARLWLRETAEQPEPCWPRQSVADSPRSDEMFCTETLPQLPQLEFWFANTMPPPVSRFQPATIRLRITGSNCLAVTAESSPPTKAKKSLSHIKKTRRHGSPTIVLDRLRQSRIRRRLIVKPC